MKPLYIWAGGKNKMIPKYLETPGIPMTGYNTYVEPFFGGGAMMIYIAEHNPDVKRFVMNDVNPEIVGIYHAIKNDLQSFKHILNQYQSQWLPLTKDDRKKMFYDLRTEYTTDWQKWNQTTESAVLYFLMRTAFNGIWQTTKTSNGRFATPVGLCNQTTKVYDEWNVDEWNVFLQKVEIRCSDWSDCVSDITEQAFFFMDPPYIDSFTSYGQVFDRTEQLKLLDVCKQRADNGNLVFFCNRDDGSDIWTSNQGNLNLEYFGINYTAGVRATEADGTRTSKKATEVLLHNIDNHNVYDDFFEDLSA